MQSYYNSEHRVAMERPSRSQTVFFGKWYFFTYEKFRKQT